MNNKDLKIFPLTRFEEKLKVNYQKRPDIVGKILTPFELKEYIQWMATENKVLVNSNISFSRADYAFHLTEMGLRLLNNPADKEAQIAIFSNYGNQKEESYFLSNHDISLNQMYRYMPTHWHSNDYFEIYYALSDTCSIYFTDEIIPMKIGSVLIIPPTVIHASPCYGDDCVLMYFLLRSSTFERVFWNQLSSENLMSVFFRQALEKKQTASYLYFDTKDDADIKHLFYNIYDEYQENHSYRAQMLNTLMSEFLILLLRRYEDAAKLPHTGTLHWKPEFSAIFIYIQKNFSTVTLADVATRFNYSERQVSRIVLNCTGLTFSELILKLKMERASTMLKQENASMELIAATVGYSTLSSFYRSFEKYYHCTPGRYRIKQDASASRLKQKIV